MPTYVYECSKCKDIFEVEQRITENALDSCPCGSTGTVKRLIQPVGVMFKGAGFHINDYAGSSKTPEVKSEGSAAAKPESKAVSSKPSDAPAVQATAAESPGT